MLPKTNAYVKSYDEQTKLMYFLIEVDDVLKKYNTICDKVTPDMKKRLIASLPQTRIFENQNKISWQ